MTLMLEVDILEDMVFQDHLLGDSISHPLLNLPFITFIPFPSSTSENSSPTPLPCDFHGLSTVRIGDPGFLFLHFLEYSSIERKKEGVVVCP